MESWIVKRKIAINDRESKNSIEQIGDFAILIQSKYFIEYSGPILIR